MKKKLLSLLITMVLTIAFVSLTTLSVSAKISGIFAYAIRNNEEILIEECDPAVSGSVTIPDMLDGYPVTTIDFTAFYGCHNVEEVNISDNVTTIGNAAFQNLASLSRVNFGNGLETIGNTAFVGCNGLSELVFPDSLTSIGSSSFSDCQNLTRVTFGNGIKTIGNKAFYACKNLTDVTIGGSIETIGDHAFRECDNLQNVYFMGTKEQWDAVLIGKNNSCLTNATIHFQEDMKLNQDEITVVVNGQKVQFDVQPQIINSRTMVPLRAIFEALGATVEWNQAEQRVLAEKWYAPTRGYVFAEFVIGRDYMRNSFGNGYYELDSPPIIMDGRTLIPARAAAEAFNYNVEWDGATRTVSIYE